jgi:hypothetical protein
MIPKLSILLVVALGGGALLAGCGSSSPSSSQSTASPARKGPTGRQAVELCKHGIQVTPGIPASAKPKLEQDCAKTASGGQAATQEVVKKVCEELVNASHIPTGAAKQRALSVCRAP